MSFTLKPLTEEEINSADLLQERTYHFDVIKSERGTSKAGNPMNVVLLKIKDNFNSVVIQDWLVFSDNKFTTRKIKHFCDTTGLQEEYNKGEIRESLTGLSGIVHIGIKDEEASPSGGFYPRKNYVIDYVLDENGNVKFELDNAPVDFTDDSIPF